MRTTSRSTGAYHGARWPARWTSEEPNRAGISPVTVATPAASAPTPMPSPANPTGGSVTLPLEDSAK
ncbi:hypothetical protein ASQ49_15330 [Acidipropionibacterium acidipropionici]|nr:hypothetical protein ASQ49_15330 [Acidipropionibacterium acidipropionici]